MKYNILLLLSRHIKYLIKCLSDKTVSWQEKKKIGQILADESTSDESIDDEMHLNPMFASDLQKK